MPWVEGFILGRLCPIFGEGRLLGLRSRDNWSELGHVSTLVHKGCSEINILAEHVAAWTQSGLRMGCVCV